MGRLTYVLLLFVAPGYAMWTHSGRPGAPPWRALWFQSLTRLVLIALLAWLVIDARWWPAAVLITALAVMTLANALSARKFETFRSKQ